jgi:hypothetical protein
VAAPLIAAGAIAVAALAPSAHAQTVPPALGADLLRSCNALIAYAKQRGEITADATSCAAYLKGLRDAMDASSSRNFPEQQFCAAGASLDEMARAIVEHLKDRSESVRRQASVEALTALNRTYPCATKKPGG